MKPRVGFFSLRLLVSAILLVSTIRIFIEVGRSSSSAALWGDQPTGGGSSSSRMMNPQNPPASAEELSRVLEARRRYPSTAQMGREQMDHIMSVLPPNGNLLVWGLGNDSPYWHNATTGKVVFLEDDFPFKKDGILWYDEITGKYPFLSAFKVTYTTHNTEPDLRKHMQRPWNDAELAIPNFPQDVVDTVWDVILVDAPLGCCDAGPARFQSLYTTMTLARNQLRNQQSSQVHVFVDDYERPIERQFSQRVFADKAPHKVTTRTAGVSNANAQAHFILEHKDCIVDDQCSRTFGAIAHPPSLLNNKNNNDNANDIPWTVLLTVNDGFYDFFLNWLAHYKRITDICNTLNVLVIAEDDVVYEKLRQEPRIPAAFTIERSQLQLIKEQQQQQQIAANHSKETAALDYESPNYMKMVSSRANLILHKLQQGHHILYSDVDTVWRSNPLPYLTEAFSDTEVDLVGQTDDVPGDKTYPYYCTGLLAIRNTPRSVQLMKDWQTALQTPQVNQPIFNKIVKSATRKQGFVHKALPHIQFPHGGKYFDSKWGSSTNNQREQAVVVHNNYIVGHDEKKERFSKYGLWLLSEQDSNMPAETTSLTTTLVNDGSNNTHTVASPILGSIATLMVTPYSAKPGTQKYRIQVNTLRALALLRPEINVVVFSKDQDGVVEDMCKPLGIQVIKDFETNDRGTPFLRSMFQRLEMDFSVQSSFIGYVNADIIFDSRLITTLQAIRKLRDSADNKELFRRLLIVGRRTNVEMDPNGLEQGADNRDNEHAIPEDREKLDALVRRLQTKGELFQTNAQDFFIITPGSFDWNDIPDFVVGRPGYDNWLVDHVYHQHETTHSMIDVTETVMSIHQTGVDGNKAGFNKRPDTEWNLNLAKARAKQRSVRDPHDHGHTVCADWETTWTEPAIHKSYIAVMKGATRRTVAVRRRTKHHGKYGAIA